MSFKAIILLTRAEGATHDQFADWWLKQHAPLAKQLPNLRKGVFNLVENPVDGDPDGVFFGVVQDRPDGDFVERAKTTFATGAGLVHLTHRNTRRRHGMSGAALRIDQVDVGACGHLKPSV
jgi:hypothetical protein